MKFITAIILTALLSFSIGLFPVLPWWSFAITSIIIAIAIHQKPWKAFLAAFIAVFVLWAIIVFVIDNANHITAGWFIFCIDLTDCLNRWISGRIICINRKLYTQTLIFVVACICIPWGHRCVAHLSGQNYVQHFSLKSSHISNGMKIVTFCQLFSLQRL